jgi:hypothetical protein
VYEAKRLWELKAENARLKMLLAEAALYKALLKDVLSNSWCDRQRVNSWLVVCFTRSAIAGPIV